VCLCSDGDCGYDLFETDSEEEEEEVKDRTQDNILPKKKTAFQVQREQNCTHSQKTIHKCRTQIIDIYKFICCVVIKFINIVGILNMAPKYILHLDCF